ncbi:hypothetical protein [Aquimarina longa]|uniref:hypothetical protein n=1 Tax=Aquimarina longa TaxID=1080221 RepID=UPI00078649BB|nr:hypothetical protein [Aquimarina longa]
MKKVIVFLVVITLITINCKGQENNCTNIGLYTILFEEMKLYERKAVEIRVGYKPTNFIVNSIDEMNIFNDKEMEHFNNLPKDIDYLSCAKFKRQIELILSDNLIRANGSYNSYKFSKVISLSDSKKCILMYTVSKNKKYKGGKIIGHEIIYIFNLIDGKWVLEDRKIIATY